MKVRTTGKRILDTCLKDFDEQVRERNAIPFNAPLMIYV
jgi:hypothetical protein